MHRSRARDLLQGDALEQQKKWLDDLSRLTLGQTDPVAVADKWQKGDVAEQINWLISWLHDLLCWQVGAEVVPIEQLDADVQQNLKTLQPALLHRFQEKLLNCKRRLSSGANPNKQLLLEELLMDWGVLLKNRQSRL